MANVDFPRGFEIIRKVGSEAHTVEYFDISSSNGAIGKGDLVEMRSDGYAHPAQASSVTIIGTAAEYKAANAGGQIGVNPIDPSTRLRAQVDDNSVAAQTNLGLNYDIVATSPNTTTGQSRMEIDGSTGATTSTLPIKVWRVEATEQYGKTNTFGEFVVVECSINANALYGGGAGV